VSRGCIDGRLGHDDGVHERPHNPCERHRCHACCIGTRMTLTSADVARLEAAGCRDFFRLTRNGDLELVNRDGHCVFLDGGRCSVYQVRPEGCRLYPLVLDLDSDRVVRDEFCPHRVEFPVDTSRVVRLRRSVACESAEAEHRLRGMGD
jgi:Fe-S-cluster containining protein